MALVVGVNALLPGIMTVLARQNTPSYLLNTNVKTY